MKITIDFDDGAYLEIVDEGECVTYEDAEVDFQGTLKETLKVLPKSKKVEILQEVFTLSTKQLGVYDDKNRRGTKAINWS